MPRSFRSYSAAVAASLITVAACSGNGVGPATTPATVATTSTTSVPTTTTTRPPAASSTTTTTLDRVAEIEAIVRDLEERRLLALFEGDEEAFRALFASEGYLERSLELFGTIEFAEEPRVVTARVESVLADSEDCLAVTVFLDETQALGPNAVGKKIYVFELTGLGDWGYSFGGQGWTCDGPHPLDGHEADET